MLGGMQGEQNFHEGDLPDLEVQRARVPRKSLERDLDAPASILPLLLPQTHLSKCFNAIRVQVLSWEVTACLDRMFGTKMVRRPLEASEMRAERPYTRSPRRSNDCKHREELLGSHGSRQDVGG